MANLTISVNDDTLKQARMRALEENRSVNAILGQYLEDYARTDEILHQRRKALNTLRALAEQCQCGRKGNAWTRDELHER
jgi:hypothetical protein